MMSAQAAALLDDDLSLSMMSSQEAEDAVFEDED
jgi:hypothetical protein